MAMAEEAVSVESTQRMEEEDVMKEETGAVKKIADSSSEVVVAALSLAICWNDYDEHRFCLASLDV